MRRGSRSPIRRHRIRGGRIGPRPLVSLLATSLLPLLLLSLPASASAAELKSIRVEPGGLTMNPEQVRQFVAIAEFNDGTEQDITEVAEWTTGDSRIAKVSLLHGSRGEVTARGPGSVEIRAALVHGGNKTKGKTVLTVFAGAIVEITTRPSSKNLDVGIPTQYKARARYQINDYVGDVSDEVTWSSSDPSKASVNAEGLVTPLSATAEGAPVVISAHHGPSGRSNSAADGATIIKAQITHIDFDDDLETSEGDLAVTMGAGMVTPIDVYAYRIDGTRSRITKDIAWGVWSLPGIVEIEEGGDFAGDAKGLSDGTAYVFGTAPELGGLTTVRILKITVSGVLSELVIANAAPFKTTVHERKTAKVKGRLSTGIETVDLRKVLDWTSANPAIAEVGPMFDENVGKILGVTAGSTTVTATEPNTGVSVTVPVEVRSAFVDVTVSPTPLTLGVGMYFPLTANAIRSDGSKSTVTGSVTWNIRPEGIGRIPAGGIDIDNIVFGQTAGSPRRGVLETLAAGTARISATLNAGTEHEVISPEIDLVVEGTLVGVRVKPTSFKIVRNQRRKASLVGDLSSGAVTSDLAGVASWQIADTTVGLVGNGGDVPDADDPLGRGEVLGVETGVTTLSATEPLTGLTSTEVDNLQVQGDIVSVEVDEARGGVVQVGTPGEYKARATYSDGSTGVISDRCEWSSDDESIATVNNTDDKGSVTGLLIGGNTRIRIDCDGLEANGRVEVAGDIVGLEVSPETFRGKALGTRRFRAAAEYVGGARGDATNDVTWGSTNPSVATVDDTTDKGLVTFIADGNTLISAVADSGHVATSDVTVTGGIERVRVVPNSKTIRGSTGRKLRVVAELSDGDKTNVYNVAWSSSDERIARMSDREGERNLVLGGARTGTATVTATLPGGESGSTEITIDSLLTAITMRPDRRTIAIGKHRRVTARGHFDDGKSKSVSRYVEFISDDPGIAIVQSHGNRPGRVIAIAPGTTTIRAVDPATGVASDNLTIIEVVAP